MVALEWPSSLAICRDSEYRRRRDQGIRVARQRSRTSGTRGMTAEASTRGRRSTNKMQRAPTKHTAAWWRGVETARRKALAILERLGASSDHLPEEWRKKAHKKLVADL